MTDQPTLGELMLAYDRGDGIGAGFERLHRGGMITLQGLPTQEGERTLVRAYRARASASDDLLNALVIALPYVEDAERDPAYKPRVVARVVAQMRAAIAKAGAAQ